MGWRDDHRRFERLAEMQRLVRELRRHEVGESCAAADAWAEVETRSLVEHEADASALEEMFGAPRLCVDRFALAVRQLQVSEAALAEARRSAEAARETEESARASLHRADHRAQLIGDIASKLRRKRADKRENETILQTTAVNATRETRP